FQLFPDSEVGGNRSPLSMLTTRGSFTFPPLGPTSLYFPAGLLSSPGLCILVMTIISSLYSICRNTFGEGIPYICIIVLYVVFSNKIKTIYCALLESILYYLYNY